MTSSPSDAPIPFCAFNGGSDVWVDIGNKLIGVQILQNYLNAKPGETFHIGDQVGNICKLFFSKLKLLIQVVYIVDFLFCL